MKMYIVDNDSQEKKGQEQESANDSDLERIAHLYNKYRKFMELLRDD